MAKLLNWFKNRNALISILVLLIAIPLYPKFPLKEVGGTWVSIRVDDLLVAIVLFSWFLGQALKGFEIRKQKTFWLILIFWLAGLISAISSIFVIGTARTHLVLFHWFRRIEYISVFLVAFDASRNKKELKNFLTAIFISLIGVFIFGLGQKYWRWPVVSTMNSEFSKGVLLYLDQWTRISSTFAGHYDLAVWLVMILSLLPAIFVFLKQKWQKLFIFLFFCVSFYLLILTASRVSFVAYLIGTTTTLFLIKKRLWILPLVVTSLFFGFQSKELNARLASSFKTVPLVGNFLSRKKSSSKPLSLEKTLEPTPTSKTVEALPAETKKTGGDSPPPTPKPTRILREVRTWPTPEEAGLAAARSSSIRFQVEWPRAIKAFIKNPLLGTGYSSLGLATDNDYFRMLGETGLLGTASFLLLIFTIFKNGLLTVIKKRENYLIVAGLLGTMIGFLSNAVFIDVFEASKIAFYFWIMMGVMTGLASNTNVKKRS